MPLVVITPLISNKANSSKRWGPGLRLPASFARVTTVGPLVSRALMMYPLQLQGFYAVVEPHPSERACPAPPGFGAANWEQAKRANGDPNMFPRVLYGFHDLHTRVQVQRQNQESSLRMLDDQVPESHAHRVAKIRTTQDTIADEIEEYTQESLRLCERLLNVMHFYGLKEQLHPAAVSIR